MSEAFLYVIWVRWMRMSSWFVSIRSWFFSKAHVLSSRLFKLGLQFKSNINFFQVSVKSSVTLNWQKMKKKQIWSFHYGKQLLSLQDFLAYVLVDRTSLFKQKKQLAIMWEYQEPRYYSPIIFIPWWNLSQFLPLSSPKFGNWSRWLFPECIYLLILQIPTRSVTLYS